MNESEPISRRLVYFEELRFDGNYIGHEGAQGLARGNFDSLDELNAKLKKE
jgi:hypothetical protein